MRTSTAQHVVALALIFACGLAAAKPSLPSKQLRKFHLATIRLNEWDVEGARPLVEELAAALPEAGPVRYLKAKYLFYSGRYSAAEKELRALLQAGAPIRREAKILAELVGNVRSITKDFAERKSSGGHFLIRHSAADEVLFPYVDEALERAYQELGDVFAYYPHAPVRVEIYPRVEHIAAVSTLEEEEVRATGTTALCKYNRLMLVSPSAYVHGYKWLDTIAHEYAHLLITRSSKNRVPIWLHEGMAKYFESSWRQQKPPGLEEIHKHLLIVSLRKGKLISFSRMSPSIARLPSQRDAALAFAQVFSVIDMLVQKKGIKGIRRLIRLMREGKTDEEAIEEVFGLRFRYFGRRWREHVRSKGYRPNPDLFMAELLVRGKHTKADELKLLKQKKARKHTMLGDMLQVRRRNLAALKEYRKASREGAGPNPLIQNKIASVCLKLDRPDEVISSLDAVSQLYPSYFLSSLHLGQAHLKLGHNQQALTYLKRAVGINPFDIQLHLDLATALEKLGQHRQARLERQQVQRLRENREKGS